MSKIEKLSEEYEKYHNLTLDRLERSRELYFILSGKDIDIKVNSSLKNFFARLVKKKEFKKLSSWRKEKVVWNVFVFLNQWRWILKNSSGFTAIFDYNGINSFLKLKKKDIIGLLKLMRKKRIPSRFVSGIMHGRWMPDLDKLSELWEFINANEIKRSFVSGMMAGRWMPDLKELGELLEFINANEIKPEFVSGMMHGRWIPNLKKLGELLKFIKDNKIEPEFVSGMMAGRWIPGLKEKKIIQFVSYFVNNLGLADWPTKNIVSLKIYIAKEIIYKKKNIEEIKTEIKEVKDKLDEKGLSYYLFWGKIENYEDLLEYLKSIGFTELQIYFMKKYLFSNIAGLLAIVKWKDRKYLLSYEENNRFWEWYYDEWREDSWYEEYEKEDTWKKLFSYLENSDKLKDKEKDLLKKELTNIINWKDIQDEQTFVEIMYKDEKLIEIIKDFIS